MPSEIRLTPASYIVLGLLDAAGEATPYELKGMIANGLGEFWSVQHAQIYSEPERLAQAGFVSERREEAGRRRRHYSITGAGKEALEGWLEEPTTELTELRDLGLLKLFFGADPSALAVTQVPVHQAKLVEHERMLREIGPQAPLSIRLALEAGIGHEREWVRFWSHAADAQ